MSTQGRLVVRVVYPSTGPFDAIAQHAQGLVAELDRRGAAARWESAGPRAIFKASLARDCDWLFIEYMPYAYGRWGAAPGLVLTAAVARLMPRGPRLALMVHETPVAEENRRRRLMRAWQQWQLRALACLAERLFASTAANGDVLRAMKRRSRIVHLPIPSNVPRATEDRDAARQRLGIGADELAIAVFGGRHPSRALGHIEAAVTSAAEAREACTLLNLGGEAPRFTLPAAVRVIAPGPSSPAELSAQLAAADLYVAAFHDGASTRRTTLAAALAHGLPVVGTDGEQTDAALRDSDACLLVPVDDVPALAAACRLLALDDDERERRGRAALELYAAVFDWRAVGARLADAIAEIGRAPERPSGQEHEAVRSQ